MTIMSGSDTETTTRGQSTLTADCQHETQNRNSTMAQDTEAAEASEVGPTLVEIKSGAQMTAAEDPPQLPVSHQVAAKLLGVASGREHKSPTATLAEASNVEFDEGKTDPVPVIVLGDGKKGDLHSNNICGPTGCNKVPLSDMVTTNGTGAPRALASSDAVELGAEKSGEASVTNGVCWAFTIVFLLEVFVNFDAGVVPAILPTLEQEFGLDGTTEGLLGALPYIGLVLSSPFVGRGLTLFSPKYFCLFTMFVNVLATGLFGVAVHRWILFISRLLMGLTQAGFSIYAPVWVDRFAPPEKLTLWMGLAQGGVVIGTMLGCVTAGALDEARRAGVQFVHWRYALLIQFVCLFVLVIAWCFTPRYLLEIQLASSADERESVTSSRASDASDSVASGEEASSEEEDQAGPRWQSKDNTFGSTPVTALGRHDLQGGPQRGAESAAPQVSIKVTTVGDEAGNISVPEEAGGGRKKLSTADTAGVSFRERRSLRSGHRQSDLPEYLKDPLSNLLPLDFFASNAQPRRAAQAVRHSLAVSSGRRRHSTVSSSAAVRSLRAPISAASTPEQPSSPTHSVGLSRGDSVGETDTQGLHESGGDRQTAPALSRRQWTSEVSQHDSRAETPFQYQMTLLTPQPTTLAFEAFNWASGTQDPMLLVQRETRQPTGAAAAAAAASRSSAATTAGESSTGEGPYRGDAHPKTLSGFAGQAAAVREMDKSGGKLPKVTAVQAPDMRPTTSQLTVKPKTYGVRESIRILFASPLYVCVTFSLCALFFEVTAIQFWSITYFQKVLKHSTSTVLIVFNVTAATAPILGVLGGGWCIDFIGGYKDEQGMRTTMSILLMWAFACFLLGLGAGWTTDFWVLVSCVWLIMFLGGGILPAATGIVIASVPVEVRAFGSGFCMMIYNVFGYVLGTFLPGIMIETVSLVWGMRVTYLWSVNGVIGFLLACCFLRRLEIKPTFISDNDEGRWRHSRAPNREYRNTRKVKQLEKV